jgi:S1-C subfamily serine protease
MEAAKREAPGLDRRTFMRLWLLGAPLAGPTFGPDFVALVQRVSPSVVAIGNGSQSIGSGFVVGPSRVITAAHVVKEAGASPTVTAAGSREAARIVRVWSEPDLAVLVLGRALPPLPLAPAPPQVGEWIVVVGNPFGSGLTATVGIVSAAPGAIAATPALARQIQIDASVNPGNSGVPVCNLRGEVVGATTSLVASAPGIAFATPAAAIRVLLSTLDE